MASFRQQLQQAFANPYISNPRQTGAYGDWSQDQALNPTSFLTPEAANFLAQQMNQASGTQDFTARGMQLGGPFRYSDPMQMFGDQNAGLVWDAARRSGDLNATIAQVQREREMARPPATPAGYNETALRDMARDPRNWAQLAANPDTRRFLPPEASANIGTPPATPGLSQRQQQRYGAMPSESNPQLLYEGRRAIGMGNPYYRSDELPARYDPRSENIAYGAPVMGGREYGMNPYPSMAGGRFGGGMGEPGLRQQMQQQPMRQAMAAPVQRPRPWVHTAYQARAGAFGGPTYGEAGPSQSYGAAPMIPQNK